MTKQEAIRLSENFPEWVDEGPLSKEYRTASQGCLGIIKWFITALYNQGYKITFKV